MFCKEKYIIINEKLKKYMEVVRNEKDWKEVDH